MITIDEVYKKHFSSRYYTKKGVMDFAKDYHKIKMEEKEDVKKYRVSYYYLATGMEGRADSFPEQIVSARNEDEACYKYFKSNGIDQGTFEEFMKKPEHHRRWGITIEEIK